MAAVSYAVDVSNNQAAHQPWKSFGVNMGIAKASEGMHTRDPWFARHIADIKAAGLLPGGYHFAWPNQPAPAEAANYIAAVRTAAAGAPFVHFLDLEAYPDGAKNYVGATASQIRAYATAWVTAVKTAFPGQRVLVYTSRDDVAAGHYPPNADGHWYPAYPVQGRAFAAAAGLARPQVGGRQVWGWQFTSVPRDQTVIYMAPAALRAWATGTTSTPQEDDMQLTDAVTLPAQAKVLWPTDKGVADGKVAVNTALGSGYVHARRARENTDVLLGRVDALTKTVAGQTAAIAALAAKVGSGDDVATIVAAVQQAIKDEVVRVEVVTTPPEATEA